MMDNLKSAKRILSCPVSCTFGEWGQKTVNNLHFSVFQNKNT